MQYLNGTSSSQTTSQPSEQTSDQQSDQATSHQSDQANSQPSNSSQTNVSNEEEKDRNISEIMRLGSLFSSHVTWKFIRCHANLYAYNAHFHID